jgi:hypothetical protein
LICRFPSFPLSCLAFQLLCYVVGGAVGGVRYAGSQYPQEMEIQAVDR